MLRSEVNIRDPYVLVDGGKYYLFGTRSATCWGPADGLDCYVSDDLEHWSEAIEVFHRPDGFWADRNYWAPECYAYRGSYYLLTTLGGEARPKSVNLLQADRPIGPYRYVATLTRPGESAIDGTLWLEGETPFLVYSHDLFNGGAGEMYGVALTQDLSAPVGEPFQLFAAPEAPWAVPIPFAKAEFGIDRPVYFSDGPTLLRLSDGKLGMTWSGWSKTGYAVGVAYSDSGDVHGPWRQMEHPLFEQDGGHGMFFRTREGTLCFSMHHPDTKYQERPIFWTVEEVDGALKLGKRL